MFLQEVVRGIVTSYRFATLLKDPTRTRVRLSLSLLPLNLRLDCSLLCLLRHTHPLHIRYNPLRKFILPPTSSEHRSRSLSYFSTIRVSVISAAGNYRMTTLRQRPEFGTSLGWSRYSERRPCRLMSTVQLQVIKGGFGGQWPPNANMSSLVNITTFISNISKHIMPFLSTPGSNPGERASVSPELVAIFLIAAATIVIVVAIYCNKPWGLLSEFERKEKTTLQL